MAEHGIYKVDWKKLKEYYKTYKISPGSRIVFELLLRHAGKNNNAFPSQALLADSVGKSIRQVRNYLAELKKLGYLTHWKRRGYSGVNRYFFNPEIYYQNVKDVTNGTSSHSSNTVPDYSGSKFPDEVNQVNIQVSSELLTDFENTFRRRLSSKEKSVLSVLDSKYENKDILSALQTAVRRNPPKLSVAYVSRILSDYIPNSEKKEAISFRPCGHGSCVNGYFYDPCKARCECLLEWLKSHPEEEQYYQ